MNKTFAYLLVAALLLSVSHASAFSLGDQGTFTYPTIWADVPDLDVIRVGDAYYMTSTTMHMNPGVPIMKSTDLVNWEIVNYVYDILAEGDKQTLSNGQDEYSRGSWASSLRYHSGRYYVAFASYSTGKTYIYQTTDIENGPWTRSELGTVYHDMSLLFDDDGRVYMVYGSANIYVIELTADATAIKAGGVDQLIISDAGQIVGQSFYVAGEGAHIYKLNGQYYIFLISWPAGGMRTELCYRANSITGAYKGQVVFRDSGVAQGGIVDTPDGQWYAMLFQDHGSVGRIPYIVPVTWESDWPVFGNDGTMPYTTIPEIGPASNNYITASDEFDQGTRDDSGSNLDLVWQWNHNPDNQKWSLAERPGYLRLKTGRISTSILDARNTLTQRTFGPECSGRIAMDISHMKNGDYAGLAAFQYYYGYVGVKMVNGQKYLVMVRGSSNQNNVESTPVEIRALPVYQDTVYLKVEFDFNDQTDKAYFYYSLDGSSWTAIGESLQMVYLLKHFMGYRFGLFNYATTTTGGYVDIDYFRLDDQMTGENSETDSIESYNLTVDVSAGGTVAPTSGTYASGTRVTLVATADEGYEFVEWGGDVSGTKSSITVIMDSDKDVTATFGIKTVGGSCDDPESISAPIAQNGAGEYCWFTTDDIGYVNSWNMDTVQVNGVDYTNTWSNAMPDKQDGGYYIYYLGSHSWSHFEATALN